MNAFKKLYCRAFQTVFKIALPILPYREPQMLDSIDQIPDAVKKSGKRKPLIITDKTVLSLPVFSVLESALRDAEIDFEVFSGAVANPTTDCVESALELYKKCGCDSLIAFGGGSPIDCAKGVGARVARPKKSLNELSGILKVRKKIPTLIAIPTTAGTGSETTLACVVVDGKTRHKYAINDFPLIPSYAVLDARTTETLPANIAATTGMDALTHAVESYIGRSGNASTRADALEAARLIFENLEKAVDEKDETAQKNMLIASHLAGRSFSKAYVGYVHALAHALGGKYDTPHGLANAVILPIVLKEYGRSAEKRLAKMAEYAGLCERGTEERAAAAAMISAVERLNEKFKIPKVLDFIRKEDVGEMATYADKEANPLYPVPQLWDGKKLAEMLEKIGGNYDGK